MFKKVLFLCITCLFLNSYAQEKNIFLDRDFWSKNPSIETIEEKIKEGNNATKLNPHGFDAVVCAILADVNNKTIQHLLHKKGNDVNKLTHDKRTYIFWAAYKGNVELMKYLISNGAKMNLKDAHHFSVLTFAAVAGKTNKEIYELCMNNGIDIKTDIDEHGANALLLITPYLKDFEMIDYFKSKGLSINDKDADGNGVFAYAAKKGNKKIIESLILNKITAKSEKNTMLFATQSSRGKYNSLEFFKYLESVGVKANITDKNMGNPLNQLAYKCSDIETLQYFLDKGLSINNADGGGETPLTMSGYGNSLEAIKFLLKNGADISAVNKYGASVLSNAIQYNNATVVDFLLKQGADVNIKDKKGNHLGYYLIKSFKNNSTDFTEKVKLLGSKGFNFTEPLANRNTLLHLAIKSNNLNLLKALEEFNIDLNALNKEGNSVLHIAAMASKNTDILKYLIKNKANKKLKTEFGETAFDLAKENEVLKKQNIDFLK